MVVPFSVLPLFAIWGFFDSDLSMESHISSICRSSHHYIRQIRQIRSSITHKSAVLLANSLVSSRLDFCNSLYFNLPKSSIKRLQLVQNSLARAVVPSVRKHDHISSTMRDVLHWLPIQQRITFKIAVLTYKAYHRQAPKYMVDLVTPYKPARSLRSASGNLIETSRPTIKSATGRRSFAYAAPHVWNDVLTLKLRSCSSLSSFRAQLKTHLFSELPPWTYYYPMVFRI